jgi:hypothetical protein
LASTFRDAAFSRAVAALSVRSPCRAAASRHNSRTVAVATPRPATCCATGDKHVEGADASLLLSQQGSVPVGELVEELVASVGDKGSEVGAVRQLEGQDRRGMASMQPL